MTTSKTVIDLGDGQSVQIGDNIVVTVVRSERPNPRTGFQGKAYIGVTAPLSVKIMRPDAKKKFR